MIKVRGENMGSFRSARMALLCGMVFLTGCQTTNSPAPQVSAPLPVPQDNGPTTTPQSPVQSAKAAGWSAGFDNYSTGAGERFGVVWRFCLKKAGDRWSVEEVQSCPLKDGDHEQVFIDYNRRRVDAYVTTNSDTLKFQKPDDAANQRNFYCKEQVIGGSNLKEAHNVCVSAFSKTYINPAETVGGVIAAPLWAIGNKRTYFVEVDREAILAAAISSGALDQGLERAKAAVGAKIDTLATSQDLLELRSYSSRILANEPGLLERVNQRIDTVRTAEAEVKLQRDEAARKADEQQRQIQAQQFAQAEAARRQEINRNRQVTETFRRNVKVGSETHCGLVLSMNGPVAVVQAPAQVGQYGMKISQLYPRGLATCNFFNGVYQDPVLPY